jgi:hypothetical protein
MTVRKLRDLSRAELARVVHLQKITRDAWHDRKNPDDGILNLTEAMEAKKADLSRFDLWIGIAAIGFVGAVGGLAVHGFVSILKAIFS